MANRNQLREIPVEISYFCRSCKGHYIGYTDVHELSAGHVRCKCGASEIHVYVANTMPSLKF